MNEDRMFPMQGGPPIPWYLAQAIYRLYQELFTNDQSLERIAERGGFGWEEIKYFAKRKQTIAEMAMRKRAEE